MNPEPNSASRRSWSSWIKISEVVGVLALIIAALSFWDNLHERKLADSARQAAEQAAQTGPAFVLVGQASSDGGRIALRPAHEDHVIQSQILVFPAAVRADTVETTGDPRIEAGWIEAGLRKLGGGHDAGDRRAPVGISTSYLFNGDVRVDQSIYEVGYRLEPRFLRAPRLVLEGVSVARRGVQGDLKAAVERTFKAQQATAP